MGRAIWLAGTPIPYETKLNTEYSMIQKYTSTVLPNFNRLYKAQCLIYTYCQSTVLYRSKWEFLEGDFQSWVKSYWYIWDEILHNRGQVASSQSLNLLAGSLPPITFSKSWIGMEAIPARLPPAAMRGLKLLSFTPGSLLNKSTAVVFTKDSVPCSPSPNVGTPARDKMSCPRDCAGTYTCKFA